MTILIAPYPKPGIGSVITNIRLAKDTLERIAAVLHGGELRSDFVRAAVEAELHRRECAAGMGEQA
jgi:hypothetical protein